MRLILLQRQPAFRLSCYELLLSHLSPSHPQSPIILNEISLLLSGTYGEERVDQAMLPFSTKAFLAFQNALFPFAGETVQIDHLFLTPCFALVIETKHIKGHLFLDPENEQMHRIKNGTIQCFTHPVLQLERQVEGLEFLFTELQLSLPIFKMVVFTHSDVFLESAGANRRLPPEICRIERLTSRVRKLLRENTQEVYSESELLQKARLLRHHIVQEKLYDVMKKFKIDKKELLGGVWCKNCRRLSMKWISLKWHCTICNSRNRHAHKRSFEAYFRFISPTITNREARNFLKIDSPDTARRLLLTMNLKTKGNCRSRRYLSPF